jgi:hypothetical protein
MSVVEAYRDGKFLLMWSFATLLTVGVPVVIFGIARLANSANSSSSQYNEYANAQSAQNAAAYNSAYYNGGQQQYAKNCYWWQSGCNNSYQAKSYAQGENHAPWWWLWSEDERREDGVIAPTVIVVYVWHLIVLWALFIHGRRSVVGGASLHGVAATCLMFANYSFVSMLLLGGLTGAVFDDADSLDKDGWYGQIGVLVYMTNIASVILGISYYFGFRSLAIKKETTHVDVTPSDYMKYDAAEPKEKIESA